MFYFQYILFEQKERSNFREAKLQNYKRQKRGELTTYVFYYNK